MIWIHRHYDNNFSVNANFDGFYLVKSHCALKKCIPPPPLVLH